MQTKNVPFDRVLNFIKDEFAQKNPKFIEAHQEFVAKYPEYENVTNAKFPIQFDDNSNSNLLSGVAADLQNRSKI